MIARIIQTRLRRHMRVAAVMAAMALVGSGPAQSDSTNVTDAGLGATFAQPDNTARSAAGGKGVVFIAGSGPTDRNGNSGLGVQAGYLRLLSEALVRDGIFTLRYDKRGVGASKAALTSESDLRFSDFVDDAESWARWLRKRPGVSCIFLLGHSQGGLVATLAAPEVKTAGLVLLSSPGRSFGALLQEQLAAAPMDAKLKADALAIVKDLEAGKTPSDVPPGLQRLFRPSVQPFLISLMNIDPAAELAALKTPTLIVSGGHDLQVAEIDYQRLTAARPDATAVRIPDMNHVLTDAPAARKPNLATYANPNLPLAPGLANAVTGFINKTACPGAS
jgi:uncharacterized protein